MDQTLRARAHANGLAAPAGGVADAVRRVVALQAQDPRANRLAVRVRTAGLVADDVDAACARREVVRTWAMRGTLHMLAADDFHWVIGLLGPYFAARQAPRRRQLGLDDATCDRACGQLETVLADGALTRTEIVERMDLPLPGQAAPYLLGYAALTGLVCRGADRGDEPTYVLVRDWLGESNDTGDEARLAERYLAGHGPATAEDLAAWSGLPLGRARKGFDAVAERFDAVEAAGVPSRWTPVDATPSTRLLGHFDAYLLGYRGRELAVPAELASEIQSGGGFVMPAIAVDGRVVGTWRQRSTKDKIHIELTHSGGGVEGEITDLGRFLQRPVDLTQ